MIEKFIFLKNSLLITSPLNLDISTKALTPTNNFTTVTEQENQADFR